MDDSISTGTLAALPLILLFAGRKVCRLGLYRPLENSWGFTRILSRVDGVHKCLGLPHFLSEENVLSCTRILPVFHGLFFGSSRVAVVLLWSSWLVHGLSFRSMGGGSSNNRRFVGPSLQYVRVRIAVSRHDWHRVLVID